MSCGPEGEVVTDVALYRPEHVEDHLQQQAVSAEHGRKQRWHLSTLLSGLLVAMLALATPALMPLLGRRKDGAVASSQRQDLTSTGARTLAHVTSDCKGSCTPHGSFAGLLLKQASSKRQALTGTPLMCRHANVRPRRLQTR